MKDNENKERALFSHISAETKQKLFEIGYTTSLKKGELIFSEREEVDSIFIVVDGYVSLYRSSRYGDIKVIFICTNGEIINEIVFQNDKTSICAMALSDTTLLAIPKADLLKLMKEDVDLTINIYDSLARKTRRLYHQVGNANGTYPIEKRLAAKICKLARDYGKKTDAGTQIGFEITVTFLANMLGAKRETISRILSQIKRKGIVKHENSILTVVDMDALEKIAE